MELAKEAYEPFDGIVLTDTFQLTEDGDLTDEIVFPTNNTRAEAQKALDIRVIVGNPPYSVGQTSGNDDNANVKYPTLDARVRDTFAARTDATLKNSLYDSYMRAIRWASDRVGDSGVIGFVTNGGWIEGNTAAGVRKTLTDELCDLRVQPSWERSAPPARPAAKEGGKVFGSGEPQHRRHLPPPPYDEPRRPGDDPLPRHRRLPHHQGQARHRQRRHPRHRPLAPDRTQQARRLDQPARRELSRPTPTLAKVKASELGPSVFSSISNGVKTNRDAWVFASSGSALDSKLTIFVETYEAQRQAFLEYSRSQRSDEPQRSRHSRPPPNGPYEDQLE